MVVLNKIYTRTGDNGDTALGNGDRVAKHSARVSAYGTSDELNSFVGVARLDASGEVDDALSRIQNDLFDLGADLCRPDMSKDAESEYPPLRVAQAQVDRLEAEIDVMNGVLEPLRSFILPGGSRLSANLHVCRTVARRAERLATELAVDWWATCGIAVPRHERSFDPRIIRNKKNGAPINAVTTPAGT